MTGRERTLILATVVAALSACTLWGYARLVDAKAAAADASASLVECSRLAARIESQRGLSAPMPAAREPEAQELIHRIEAGAKTAEFPDASIERIEPGPAEPAGGGRYEEVPTIVQLRGVTLRQVFTFLHVVGAGRSGLQVKQIRLSAPRNDDVGDRWWVETILTQLVHASEDKAE